MKQNLIFIAILIIFILGLIKIGHADEIDMSKISMIESSNEPLAYNNGHVGLFQIGQGVVSTYNNDCKNPSEIKLDDMYNISHARHVADWYINIKIPQYLSIYNIPDTTVSRLIAWNWGIGHLRHWFRRGSHWNQLPRETRNYIKKYFRGDD